MQLHGLKRTHSNKTAHRIGRGGKRGKTAGRGHKGQNSRAGTGMRPEERDMIKKLPKLRGHGKNRGRTVNSDRERAQEVSLSILERIFNEGETVSPRTLVARGAVTRFRGVMPQVKVLAVGSLTKRLSIEGCRVSAAAHNAIVTAGGTVVSD